MDGWLGWSVEWLGGVYWWVDGLVVWWSVTDNQWYITATNHVKIIFSAKWVGGWVGGG